MHMSEEFLFEKANLFCGLSHKLHGFTESAKILAFHCEPDVFMPWLLVSISQVGRLSRLCPQRILSSNCFHDLEWLLVDSFIVNQLEACHEQCKIERVISQLPKRERGIHLESYFGVSETDVPFLPSGPLLFSCLPGMPGILVAGSS